MEEMKMWFGQPENRPDLYNKNSIVAIDVSKDSVTLRYGESDYDAFYISLQTLLSIPDSYKIKICADNDDVPILQKICIYGNVFSDARGIMDFEFITSDLCNRFNVEEKYRFDEIELSANFKEFDDMFECLEILHEKLSIHPTTYFLLHADLKFLAYSNFEKERMMTLAEAISTDYILPHISDSLDVPIFYDFKKLNMFNCGTYDFFDERYTKFSELTD